MLICFILLLITIVSITFFYVKDSISRWFIFILSIYWFLSIFVSFTNPFGLYDVSLRSYGYIFINLLFFYLGYFSFKNKFFLDTIEELPINSVTFYRNKYFKIIFSISLLILIYYFSKQWKIILIQNGLGNLKLDIFELLFGGNHLMYNLYECVVSPLFHIVCALLAFLLLTRSSTKKSFLWILFLYILLYSFIGGKRAYFLTFFFYIMTFYVFSNTYLLKGRIVKNFILKKWKNLLLAFSLAFIGMIFMSSLTGGVKFDKEAVLKYGKDLTSQFIIYSVGPFRALDIGLDNKYVEDAGGYLCGRATLGGGVDYYLCQSLQRLGVDIQSARALTMTRLQDTRIVIGKDTEFNYAYTNIMYHYYDFGFWGIILFPFLFGKFVRYLIHKAYIARTFSTIFLVGFLFQACIMLLQFWYFIGIYPYILVLVMLYINRKEIKARKHLIAMQAI